jgi:hypothetical protein
MSNRIKPFKNKNECLLTESDDLQGITTLCIESLKKHGGKQAIYAYDELPRFIQDVTSYFQMLHDSNEDLDPSKQIFPSIEGLCVFLGLTRKTFSAYAKRNTEWNEAIDQTRNLIASVKIQLASHGRIPPLVAVFDLCNNYQYHNTSEFRLSTDAPEATTPPKIATSELERIADSAPPQLPEQFSQN